MLACPAIFGHFTFFVYFGWSYCQCFWTTFLCLADVIAMLPCGRCYTTRSDVVTCFLLWQWCCYHICFNMFWQMFLPLFLWLMLLPQLIIILICTLTKILSKSTGNNICHLQKMLFKSTGNNLCQSTQKR